jgi:hypothetical protein
MDWHVKECSRARFSVSSSSRLVLRDVPLDAALFDPALSESKRLICHARGNVGKEYQTWQSIPSSLRKRKKSAKKIFKKKNR